MWLARVFWNARLQRRLFVTTAMWVPPPLKRLQEARHERCWCRGLAWG